MSIQRCMVVLLLACATSAWADTVVGEVVSVPDGDTLVLQSAKKTYTVHLFGLDAPELGQAYGQKCRAKLVQLVQGKSVKVNFLPHPKYPRVVGHVFQAGVDVNLRVMENGCGWMSEVMETHIPEPMRAQLDDAQAKAQANHRGLWADLEPTAPWEWRKKHGAKARSR